MMRKSLWIVPLLLLSAAVGVPAAHADTIFNVTGTFNDGATLSGTITINTTAGMVTALDLTTTETGAMGPYTGIGGQGGTGTAPNYYYVFTNMSGYSLDLYFPVSTLVGYAGSSLCGLAAPCDYDTTGELSSSLTSGQQFIDGLQSGAVAAVPEIDPRNTTSALTLLVGAVLVIRGRRRKMTQPESV